jgi:hypothetical protein
LSLPTAIREFRGLLEFTAGLIEELLGFLRMAAQLIVVRSLRFVDFLKRLQDMVLGFGEVRMPSRVNVRLRPLSKAHADQGQANDRYRDEAQSVVTLLESLEEKTRRNPGPAGTKPGGEFP